MHQHSKKIKTWKSYPLFQISVHVNPWVNVAIRCNRWKRTFSMAKYGLMTKLDVYFWNSIDVKPSFSSLKDTNSVTHSSVYWGTDKGTIPSFNEVEVLILSHLSCLDCYCPSGAPAMGCLCALKTNKPNRDWAPAQYLLPFRRRGSLPGPWKIGTMGQIKNLLLVFIAIILTALLLRRFLGIYAIIVPLLYMFFDVNWSLRVAWMIVKKGWLYRKTINSNFLDVSDTTFIVLPSDMDLNMHMNNAR